MSLETIKEIKETGKTTSEDDMMVILMKVRNLLQWSKDLMSIVVAYTLVLPIYSFGESLFTRLHHDGMVEILPRMSTFSFRSRCSVNRVEDNIYVIGGYALLTGGSSSVDRFHIPTLTWSLLPSMPNPRYCHTAVVIDHRIYVVAGRGNKGSFQKSVEIFDIKTHKWTVSHSISTFPNYGHIGVAVLGKIYIFGGYSRKVEVFDISTISMTTQTVLTSMKYDHSGGCALAIDNVRILVMGGYHYYRMENDTVEEYNIVTNTWLTLDWKLPRGMSEFAAWFDDFNQMLHVAFGDEKSNYHYVRSLKRYINKNVDNKIDVLHEPINNDAGWTLIPHSSRYQTNFGYCT
jgi:hypothetical protein